MPNQLLQVMMLGNRGVGKTSLLASMYDEFKGLLDANFTLSIPDLLTSEQIDNRLAELKGVMNTPDTTIKTMVANRAEQSYVFTLTRKPILGFLPRPPIDILFYDYPGGWTNASAPRNVQVQDQLRQSLITIVVIDTVALMYEDGRYNDITNIPNQINTLLQQTFDASNRHLILFVPMKCETYLETEAQLKEMRNRLYRAYNPLITHIKNENFAAAVVPVRTLGNVRFVNYDQPQNGSYLQVFEKTQQGARYSPQDTDQPLRYILNFLLKYYRDKSKDDWGFFKSLRDLIGTTIFDTDVDAMFRNTSLRIKTESPFEIISGEEQFGL